MKELSARILRPRRRRLAEALQVVSGWINVPTDVECWSIMRYIERGNRVPRRGAIHDPAEAWEALVARDVIPDGWAQDPSRVFDHLCSVCRGYGDDGDSQCPVCGGLKRLWAEQPKSLLDVVTVAADVDGMTTAEQLVREITAKAGFHPVKIVWRFDEEDQIADRGRTKSREWSFATRTKQPLEEDLIGFFWSRVEATRSGLNPLARSIESCVHPETWASRYAVMSLIATGYALESLNDITVVVSCPILENRLTHQIIAESESPNP